MRKFIISIIVLMLPLSACFAREIITGTENGEGETVLTAEGIGILNEELRQSGEDIKDNAADISTNASAIATNTPAGVIVLWSGAISAIPSGWVICDGNNGTPDLTDRFVIHADADSGGTRDVGDTGGAHTHTHGAGSYNLVNGTYGYTRVFTGAAGNAAAMTVEGTSAAGSTLPKHYALAYIMKT